MSKKTILIAENLAYKINANITLFKGVNLSIEQGDRIALVGSNGTGKSTLLRIIAGQVCPNFGSIKRNGVIYYLPQISTIKEQIKANTVLELLSSISEEWWQIEEILHTRFTTNIDLSLPIANLSGGELTKLFLAIGLFQQPNLLLLDEPTNHMDLAALESLRCFLNDFNGAFIIVSHKPFFLDRVVDITWELTPAGIKVYGGNFSLYREQKEIELEAAMRTHEVARKELKRAKETALKEQERAVQSRKSGRGKFLDGSIGRTAAGLIKTKAESSAGNLKKKNEVALAKATQKVAETKIKTKKITSVQLEEKSQKSKNLIDIQGANLWVSNRLLIKNINLHISSGDRVAIAGANGSGKSSLAKAILDSSEEVFFESGEILLSPSMKTVYLDQTYALINREKTILENMQAANSSLNYQLLRQQLGHFLFKYDDVNKSASVLSGGELARLALAMISISEIDLLILDEPTNNLDIETVNQLVEGINEYQGTLWVISHDLDFLSRINITKAFKLSQQVMQMTTYLPEESEQYYQELLNNS
ncbi:ABC-F family ATP-binding cassette domain-containing protein [Chlorogloeopsis sp. ULAP01]|uniref:ribosomal protection-like ABC-F family protein n=1 Tax=Chlorogloeopsis sp. ULAP01 TaxID=3056483 RepID=UPI0025AA7FED|nr:ABC-F family ATP-binding cassette domain-containing protein [Chlorogloeopsis sp. ULAP01]MDM9384205.1 ABC-F family ATP-binding cassette domain-containing protein [Chlorogloeopsis sp. ULAP01]